MWIFFLRRNYAIATQRSYLSPTPFSDYARPKREFIAKAELMRLDLLYEKNWPPRNHCAHDI